MIIYLLHNKINNKIYIGKTKNSLSCRIKQHHISSKKGEASYLYSAIRKYGLPNFIGRVLAKTDDSLELNTLESYYIQLYESNSIKKGYNMTPGGDGGPIRLGMKDKQSTKDKISIKLIGNKNGEGVIFTKERKDNISKKLTGNRNALGCSRSKEYKDAISMRMQGNKNGIGNKGPKGRTHTKEEKENIRNYMKIFWMDKKGKPFHSEETKQKIRNKRKLQIITEDHKRNISQSLLKHYQNVKNTISQKPIRTAKRTSFSNKIFSREFAN